MNKINFVLKAAVDKKGAIGSDNQLPWKLPKEMTMFLKRIRPFPVIMGRRTCESLYKPMNNQLNYVLTTDTTFKRKGFVVVHSIKELLSIINIEKTHFVVGGAQIYEEFMKLCMDNQNRMSMTVELTHIDTKVKNADTYFPMHLIEDYQMSSFDRNKDVEEDGTEWVEKVYYL